MTEELVGSSELIPAKKTLFFGMMGAPFQSELTTSVLRLTEEALKQKHEVTVWTCGYATMLTQSSLERDENIFSEASELGCADTRQSHPVSAVIQGLLREHPNHLHWYVCDYCMRERGATQQMDGVEIKIPYTFNLYLNQADISLVLGVK